jgi:heptosyltransferase-2/heptosyltransferase-3
MIERNSAPLVVRFGSLGDMVLLTGLLNTLHRRLGRPCDLLSGTTWPMALLDGHPDLGQVYRIASRSRPYWTDPEQWRLVRWLRTRPPGPVFVCDDLRRNKLARLLRRAGIDPANCVSFSDAELSARRHWFDRLADMAQRVPQAFADAGLPTVAAPDHPLLPVSGPARADLARWRAENRLDGPLVLIQPGNKRTQRRGGLNRTDHHKWWPPERWQQVIAAVLERLPDARVILCGAPSEQPLLLQIGALADDPRVRACGLELPLPRLMALCEVAHSLIAVDSGPAHIAAALGCQSVVLFGAAPPWLWQPRAPKGVTITVVGGEPDGLDRIDAIPAQAVISAWRALPGRGRT